MSDFFNGILNMSSEASYLIIAVAILRFFIKNSPKYFRKLLWGLVGIRLVMPFTFESVFSLLPKENPVNLQSFSNEINSGIVTQTAPVTSFNEIIPYIWLGVSVVLVFYGAVSFIRLKKKISDAVRLEGNIYQSEKVSSPFVCGFINPKIYIPYNLQENVQEYVLMHERTHIRQKDHILKAVAFILLCVHWFNPFVWLSYFLFCKDIELLCDELVVKGFNESERRDYALALYKIGIDKVKISACPVAFGEVGIKERIKCAIKYKKAKKTVVAVCVLLCVAVAVCFMTNPVAAVELEKDNPQNPPEETTEMLVKSEEVTEPSTEGNIQITSPGYIEEPTITQESTTKPSEEGTAKKEKITKSENKTENETTTKKDKENIKESNENSNEETKFEIVTVDVESILEKEFERNQQINNYSFDSGVIVENEIRQPGAYYDGPTVPDIELFPEPEMPTRPSFYCEGFSNNYWVGYSYY